MRWFVALVAALGLAAVSVPAGGLEGEPAQRWIAIVDDDLDVGLDSGGFGAAAVSDRRILPGIWSVDVGTAARLAGRPGVRELRPELRYAAAVLPNDTNVASQWYLDEITAPAAWDVTTGDGATTVAVVDSGVNTGHFDLAGRVTRIAGCGLTTQGNLTHGSAVAGLIGALTDNASGIAGIAWDVQLLDVQVLIGFGSDTGGTGSETDVAAGIRCAVDNGADVVNLSLVQTENIPSTVVSSAIRYAQDRGALVIAAAGNNGTTTPVYPAANDGVIGVAALDRDASLASFSSYGSWVDLAAPGVDLLSLLGTGTLGLGERDGTSFAGPLVAGGAALLKAQFPSMTFDQIGRRLAWTSGFRGLNGVEFGRLDLQRALLQPTQSMWLVTDAGQVIALGDARHHGDLLTTPPSTAAVAIALTPSGDGYWIVTASGRIHAFGGAAHVGDLLGVALNQPIVGMAVTPSGLGYWLVAADGGIFAFGDARFWGSMGAVALNEPIVGMAATPSGQGYWLVAADGGIFAFGDALFFGSTGAIALNQPVQAMVAGPTGYTLVARDAGAFNFSTIYLGSGVGSTVVGEVVGAAGELS